MAGTEPAQRTTARDLSLRLSAVQYLLVEDARLTGVIDWGNVTIGDPALDLGFTLSEIATVPIEVHGVLQPFFRAAMKGGGRRYLRSYRRMLPVDDAIVNYYQVFACVSQLTRAAERLAEDTRRARSSPPPERA